ncbi:uncharacterized protein FYW49_008992 [Xenentodon cancila]
MTRQGEHPAHSERKGLVAKRCQALTALIRLTSVIPCQELLDMQERTCQLAVATTPRDSHALCLLGLAQLAQYDNNPDSEKSDEARSGACLSFQASIELEEKPLSGNPPEQLSKQKWWKDWLEADNKKNTSQPITKKAQVKASHDSSLVKRGAKPGRGGLRRGQVAVTKAPAPATAAPIRGGNAARLPAKTPAVRGRPGAAAKPEKSVQPSSSGTKPANKSKQDCSPATVETAEGNA